MESLIFRYNYRLLELNKYLQIDIVRQLIVLQSQVRGFQFDLITRSNSQKASEP